jgi:predicted translin family RNA/ssDNA-binding protein
MLRNIVGNMESGVRRRVDANKKFLESTAHELIRAESGHERFLRKKITFPFVV